MSRKSGRHKKTEPITHVEFHYIGSGNTRSPIFVRPEPAPSRKEMYSALAFIIACAIGMVVFATRSAEAHDRSPQPDNTHKSLDYPAPTR